MPSASFNPGHRKETDRSVTDSSQVTANSEEPAQLESLGPPAANYFLSGKKVALNRAIEQDSPIDAISQAAALGIRTIKAQTLKSAPIDQIEAISKGNLQKLAILVADLAQNLERLTLSGRGAKDAETIFREKRGTYQGSTVMVWAFKRLPESLDDRIEQLLYAAEHAYSYTYFDNSVRQQKDPQPGGVMVLSSNGKLPVKDKGSDGVFKGADIGEAVINVNPDNFSEVVSGFIPCDMIGDFMGVRAELSQKAHELMDKYSGQQPPQELVETVNNLLTKVRLATEIVAQTIAAYAIDLFREHQAL